MQETALSHYRQHYVSSDSIKSAIKAALGGRIIWALICYINLYVGPVCHAAPHETLFGSVVIGFGGGGYLMSPRVPHTKAIAARIINKSGTS